TKLGLTVVITDEAAVPRVAPTPAVLVAKPGAAKRKDAGESFWRPDLSPTGPLSIVISSTDKRLLVLRNGEVIGASPVAIAGEPPGARAYTLRAVDAQGFHWLQLPL